MPDAWNPERYEQFRAERRAPFDDLLLLIRPEAAMRVVDLGCGTGDLTAALHDRLAARSTIGVDASAAMLERARAHDRPGLSFRQGDLASFDGAGGFDLVFSNAALQWLPEHEQLLLRLVDALAPRGQLAIQVPANFDYPAHVTAREIAAEEPFATALRDRPARPIGVLAPEAYASLLDRLGFAEQHVRLQVYGHRLHSRADVVDWMLGTGLTAYQASLSAAEFAQFVERYRDRLMPRLENRTPFFYPFKRILLWARRP